MFTDVLGAETHIGTKISGIKSEACVDLGTVYLAPIGPMFGDYKQHSRIDPRGEEVEDGIGVGTDRVHNSIPTAPL